MAKRRVGVEYSPSMLEPVRPGAVSPDRALYLPTFSHSVVVNKTERERERERESKKARDRERERGESSLSLPSLPFFLSFSMRVPLLPYPSPFSLSLLSLSLSLSIYLSFCGFLGVGDDFANAVSEVACGALAESKGDLV